MDAIEVMTHEEMARCVDRLTVKEAQYLKTIISRVVLCFNNEQHNAMLVFNDARSEVVTMCAINTDEAQAYAMLVSAADALSMADLSDAPAKEMFN